MLNTPETLIKHIVESIQKAENGQSKLTPEAFAAPGFTSPKVRHLLNNLGSLDGLNYLEIGVHKGATFVATNYNNKLNSSTAIDNWCEFTEGDGAVKNEFLKHCSNLLKPGYSFYEQDCFSIVPDQLPNPIDFYLYDGGHSYDQQIQALKHFYPMLADTFIFLVDDWNWPDPKNGTRQAIFDLKLNVLFEKELEIEWWNGLFVSLLRK